MGLFDKLKFWKKEGEFDFDLLAEKEIGKSSGEGKFAPDLSFEQDNVGLEEKSPFGEESTSPFQQPVARPSGLQQTYRELAHSSAANSSNKDLDLINSKLDTVKALLVVMDQRIEHLERSLGVEKKEKLW